jgi:hypothetical protein
MYERLLIGICFACSRSTVMKSTAAKLARQNAAGNGLILPHLNARLKKQPNQVSGL